MVRSIHSPFSRIDDALSEIKGKLDAAERALEKLSKITSNPYDMDPAMIVELCDETLEIIRR